MAFEYSFADFTQQVDLVKYAAYMGYEIDSKKSTPSSKAMRKNGDKVIISKKGGKWVYFSVVDDNDNGSIVNFIKNRTHKRIAEIGQELNTWLGGGVSIPTPKHYTQEVEEQVYDPERIKRIFHYCKPVFNHAYLEGRGLERALLNSERFTGRIFKDRYHNAVFPHCGPDGVCGLELKSEGKNFFAKGSEKTVWRSNIKYTDHTLIIGEAVIDALSYYQLFTPANAFCFATGGGVSAEQTEIMRYAVQHFENLQRVILIPDNDEGGDKLSDTLLDVLLDANPDIELIRHRPEPRGADWNDILYGKKP